MLNSKNAAFVLLFLFVDFSLGLSCEKISIVLCKNLGYNSTLLPNFMGHENQKDADVALRSYEPFLNHKCSKNIKLFICSVFVPMCSEHVPEPIQACRGLCEKVKNNCSDSLRLLGLDWPQELNCTSFPEPPELCMQEPEDNEDTNNEEVHKRYFNLENIENHNCPPDTTPLGPNCISLCKQDHQQQLEESEAAIFEVWVAVWSIICLIFTVFALITFIIQPKRFRWPARPILYLTSCGFVTCTIYLIRWIEGPYKTCTGISLLEKPAESLSCVGISLILLFCDLAYSLWWCIFCFVWFLSAMKEWSTEAIEKISTRLHTTVWIFSAIPMFYILMSNNINLNYLSGFCEIKTPALVLFQLFFMLLSCALAVLMLIALRNVRNTLLLAGRSPEKLERLFYRLLIISIGICVPHFLYLICQFYDTFTMVLLKLVLRKISIIFSTLWVYSPKTFQMWNDLICFCKSTNKNEVKEEENAVFSLLFPKCFRSSENVPKISSNNSPLMPQNKNVDEKKTIFGIIFSKNGARPIPVSRV